MNFVSEEAEAIANAIARFCEQSLGATWQESATTPFRQENWRQLGDLGVLALKPGPESGENHFVVAALGALGRAGFPGPLPASFLAAALLDEEAASRISRGEQLVSIGEAPLMPWASIADVFISLDGDQAALIEVGSREPVDTLGGEDWARVEVMGRTALGPWKRFSSHYDLPLAAYLVGAATKLLEETASYARERRQFGRAIGDFQGVALPLAAASTRVDAARNLLLVAAQRLELGTSDAVALTAAARRLASHAARELSYVAHQTFGAFGTIKDGPVFALSRRFQQWAHQVPSAVIPDELIDLAASGSILLLTKPRKAVSPVNQR